MTLRFKGFFQRGKMLNVAHQRLLTSSFILMGSKMIGLGPALGGFYDDAPALPRFSAV